MVNYQIEHRLGVEDGFFYYRKSDTISFVMQNTADLNGDELIEYIADCITHEHIHRAIYNLYGDTVTILFEIISEHFSECLDLIERHNKFINFCDQLVNGKHEIDKYESHKNNLKRIGFEAFLFSYNFDYDDFREAERLTKTRCNNANLSNLPRKLYIP